LQRWLYHDWSRQRQTGIADPLCTGLDDANRFSQFKLLVEKVLRQPELADDPKFSTNTARVENRELLVKIITETLIQEPLDHWLLLFHGLG
jgi:succinate--hydroxymethylglutarate CoA-transferase